MELTTAFVTGAAGFIGFHVSKRLLDDGFNVVGLDNINDYYDQNLKLSRISELKKYSRTTKSSFNLIKGNLEDNICLINIFEKHKPTYVINLAAQAGVRYSIKNPNSYIQSNLVGFGNVLETCRKFKVHHLIYASSSSVYGGNTCMPFSEARGADHPISLYAATKRANELMAHAYASLYNIPSTGLRFFTVYGPWGRPDMALFLFTKSIINNTPIEVFNNAEMIRDFTYIDDIVEGIVRLMKKPPTWDEKYDRNNPDPSSSWAPHKVFNIGNSKPVELKKYIETIEEIVGIKAIKKLMPIQPGDVTATHADTSKLEDWVGYKPNTSIDSGIKKFVLWYKDYYGLN